MILHITPDHLLIVYNVTNPKATKEELDQMMQALGWTITEVNFDHSTKAWTFRLDLHPTQKRPVSGPDNESGLPESDIV